MGSKNKKRVKMPQVPVAPENVGNPKDEIEIQLEKMRIEKKRERERRSNGKKSKGSAFR